MASKAVYDGCSELNCCHNAMCFAHYGCKGSAFVPILKINLAKFPEILKISAGGDLKSESLASLAIIVQKNSLAASVQEEAFLYSLFFIH